MKYIYAGLLAFVMLVSKAHAGLIFESGTGNFSAITDSAAFVDRNQFIGTSFTLLEPTHVDGIGAHFRNFSNAFGSLFGAIVGLDAAGLPIGSKTSLENVFAVTVFSPLSSVDTLAAIDVTLDAGNYGLVFGSGLFGADGSSAMTLLPADQVANPNGTVLAMPTPLPYWIALDGFAGRFRTFVSGSPVDVPEPGTLGLLCVSVLLLIINRKSSRAAKRSLQ